jgi:BRCT domain type II-containing protein
MARISKDVEVEETRFTSMENRTKIIAINDVSDDVEEKIFNLPVWGEADMDIPSHGSPVQVSNSQN